MLWDPTAQPDALISEFLAGYYSEIASPFIRLYMVRLKAYAPRAINLMFCK